MLRCYLPSCLEYLFISYLGENRLKAKEIAKNLSWVILTFFAFLGYFSEFRPYLETKLGIYVLGFVDGGVGVAVSLVVIFYVASFFEKKPNIELKGLSQKQEAKLPYKTSSKKVKRSDIEELIRRFESIREIVLAVHKRTGDYFSKEMFKSSSTEETRYEEHMKWLQENYPKVSDELNRATRVTYTDPLFGTKIENYDPLLQTLRYSNLRGVFENSYDLKQFEKNLESGIARLRAYLGLL